MLSSGISSGSSSNITEYKRLILELMNTFQHQRRRLMLMYVVWSFPPVYVTPTQMTWPNARRCGRPTWKCAPL